MNELKLDSLASQAGFDVGRLRAPHPGGFPREDMLALESFAELIVREMLVTCEEHPAWTGRMIGEQIKQYFGVEE